jgi:hypothetical protein
VFRHGSFLPLCKKVLGYPCKGAKRNEIGFFKEIGTKVFSCTVGWGGGRHMEEGKACQRLLVLNAVTAQGRLANNAT